MKYTEVLGFSQGAKAKYLAIDPDMIVFVELLSYSGKVVMANLLSETQVF